MSLGCLRRCGAGRNSGTQADGGSAGRQRQVTEAIVLAGGLGTRLRPVLPNLPKPMAPVAGRPFLEILLGRWVAQGVTRFVLSVGYRSEAIREHFGNAYHGVR